MQYYVLGFGVLQKLMRVTSNPDFFSGLPMQTAQHIVRQSCSDFKTWLAALKVYREDASSFTGKPKMPGYCKGDTTTYLFTNQDAVIKVECSNFQRQKFVFLCEEDMVPDSWKSR